MVEGTLLWRERRISLSYAWNIKQYKSFIGTEFYMRSVWLHFEIFPDLMFIFGYKKYWNKLIQFDIGKYYFIFNVNKMQKKWNVGILVDMNK